MKRKLLEVALFGMMLMGASGCSKPQKEATSVPNTSNPTPSLVAEETTTGTTEDTEQKPELVVPSTPATETEGIVELEVVFEGEKKELKKLTKEDKKEYEAYENTVVYGSEVRDFITSMKKQKKALALLVATQMVMDGTTAYNEPDGNIAPDVPTVGASGMKNVSNTLEDDMSKKMTFINYGAVLKGKNGDAMMTFEKDHFVAKDGLDMDGKSYVVNMRIENIEKAGAAENISDYLRMQTYPIEDAKGTLIGIAFYAIQ